MKFKMKKIMSLVLLVTMVAGLVPAKAYATEPELEKTTVLELGKEEIFELTDREERHTFTYEAEEDGTYIFYFRKLSENTIDLAWPPEPECVQYNNPVTEFQGHAVELKKGESFHLTFGVSSEGDLYSGTVGVARPAEEMKDFRPWEEVADKIPLEEQELVLPFYVESDLAYGTEWEVSVDNTEILEVDEEATNISGTYCELGFRLKSSGSTGVTVRASYKGGEVEKTYIIEVTDEDAPEENPDEPTEENSFKDISELRELCETYGEEGFWAVYDGEGPLVIESDFGLPQGAELEMNGKALEIAEGAEVELNDRPFSCGSLTVEGNLTAYSHLWIDGALKVSGMLRTFDSVNVNGNLTITGAAEMHGPDWNVRYPYEIKGIDNIEFFEDHKKVEYEVYFTSSADLKAKSEAICEDYFDHERCKYRLLYSREDHDNVEEDFAVEHDVTIPAYAYISFSDAVNYTIAEGVTFTNNGEFNIHRPLTVLGTLCNDGETRIHARDEEKGVLIIPEEGTYEGKGKIGVFGDNDDKIEDLLKADKILGDFDMKEHFHDDGNREWEFIYAAGLIKLATPLNPVWGIQWERYGNINEETGEEFYEWTSKDRPGMMTWETDRPDQAEAEIKVYKKGETEPSSSHYYGFGIEDIPEYRSIEAFMESDAESGTYYFTVQSMGDYKTYRNSDIAVSGYYEYVKPELQMEAAINLKWQDRDDGNIAWAMWDIPEGDSTEYYDGYHVAFYFSETPDGEWREIGGTGGRGTEPVTEDNIQDHFIQEHGKGYYKFQVKLYSEDVEKCCNSVYSEFSPILDLKEVPTQTTLDLEKMVQDAKNNFATADDIKDAVQQMDTEDLKLTLLTDQDNSGATKSLAELEQMAGGPAGVSVSNDAKVFDAKKVSVVGANLNTSKSEEDPITLVLDRPEKEHVIPERYNSSVAIRFSMTLDNVKDPSNLEVPVKITLPVPSTINPEFLVVFHYHADGTYEMIRPYVYKVNGQWYTDLVLTSFSDFIMTQEGDSDNSGEIDPSSPEAEPTPGSSSGSKKPAGAAAKTGDAGMMMPYTLAVVISGCCLVYFFTKRRYTK